MPLKRKSDWILVTMLGVKFLMKDGEVEVACRADRNLLRNRYGSMDRDGDVVAFQQHKREIEQAASDKYDAGNTEFYSDATVIVRESDLASPLSKKIGSILRVS
jgi:hypothetical protein